MTIPRTNCDEAKRLRSSAPATPVTRRMRAAGNDMPRIRTTAPRFSRPRLCNEAAASFDPKTNRAGELTMSDRDTDDESRRSRRRAAVRRHRAGNKDRINAQRRERYATDPEYEAKVIASRNKN